MTITKHIRRLVDIPAVIPSLIVALVHFRLCVMVGPQANVVFQRWFDTGEQAAGSDAVIASVNRILSIPIPAVFLTGHPAYPLSFQWWFASAVDSLVWGALIYASYRLAFRIFKRPGVISGLER
jgi:hypothetical protein